jgi:hypothetical protein
MNKIAITLTLSLLFLTSCGGGKGSKNKDSTPVSQSMQMGKKYTLSEGQKIIKDSEDAIVVLETQIHTGETIAILQSGSAKIE